jgi:hypothetical protein
MMPVSKTSTVAYVINTVELDMAQQYIRAEFARTIDGVADGTREMLLTGADMMAIVATPGTDQILGDQVTYALYATAIAKGVIEGSVT